MWALAAVLTSVEEVTVVDLGFQTKPTLATQIAVQVCAGLFNRDGATGGPVYTVGSQRDVDWMASMRSPLPNATSADVFVASCLRGPASGYIAYNASDYLTIPPLITLAAVLDAVPLERGDPRIGGAKLVFDTVTEWCGYGAYEAAEYMLEHHISATTTMAKMNPGLGVHDKPIKPFHPPLDGKPAVGLMDYIVKERLFNFFLNDGCIPLTKDHALMERIVTENPWPKPIVVYGYDDSFALAGDLFEAETTCTSQRNMGQVASDGCSNLGYWSRAASVTTPLAQPPSTPVAWSTATTFVALVVGDGDNVNYIKGGRRDWMLERVSRCANKTAPRDLACFPLTWTMSPQTLHLAPAWLEWYFAQAHRTQRDYFVLPPSGDTYAYPGLMPADAQAAFVAATERDCELLNTSVTVDWEFMLTWPGAIDAFYPRYAANEVVRSIVCVNVPYLVPVLAFGPGEFFKVIPAKASEKVRHFFCLLRCRILLFAHYSFVCEGFTAGRGRRRGGRERGRIQAARVARSAGRGERRAQRNGDGRRARERPRRDGHCDLRDLRRRRRSRHALRPRRCAAAPRARRRRERAGRSRDGEDARHGAVGVVVSPVRGL